MRALLTKLRALSLGMPPSHVTERVWVVANAMRLIGCSLRDDKARVKEMPGAGLDWHGIYEFIDDDPNCPNCSMDHQCSADTYLRSVAMTRTKMYALEQRDRCYVIWIYVDDFRDFVTIFEELEVAEGVARQVLRRVRVTFPKNEEHRLDSIHASTETSQVPPEDIKLLLMRGNIHVNLETSYEMHSDYVRLMRMRKHGVSC